MEIRDFLSSDHILLDLRASDKGRLLRELSALAASELGLDPNDVAEQIDKREELVSTGVGNAWRFRMRGSTDWSLRSVSLPASTKSSTLMLSMVSR